MAIDSAAKRFSFGSFGLPYWGTLIIPDGTVERQDRTDLMGLYAGLELITPATLLADAVLVDQDVGYKLVGQDESYILVEIDETHYVLKKVN